MTKLTIRGAYGETNFGDDLLMCVFENYFLTEFDDLQLNFVGENSNYVDLLLTKGRYMQSSFVADWEIYGGGTQFFAFQSKNETSLKQKVLFAINNPKAIKERIKKILVKDKYDEAKVAFLGFGIGPFYENYEAILHAKEKTSKANFVGVRDEVSYSYCTEWNIPAILGADVVFSSYFNKPDILKSTHSSGKIKIGIIVRDWDWEKSGNSYINNLLEFYKNYSDAEFQFIVFAPSRDKEWIAKLKNENVLLWDPQKYSIKSFLEELNKFDGFISARYHGAIIASLLNKPVICVEIEPKLRILTEQVKEIKLWEKPFVIKELIDLVNQLDFNVDYTDSLNERKAKADHMLLEFKKIFHEIG